MSNQRKLKVGEQIETQLRSWSLGKTPKGSKYVRLIFNNYVSKDLWLSDKAVARSMETLEMMGFNGANLGMLADDNALDTEKIWLVTIDEIQEHNGKTYYKASWINDPDKVFGGFDEKSQDLVDEFRSFDTRAYIADAKDQTKMTEAPFNPGTDQNFTSSDIPF